MAPSVQKTLFLDTDGCFFTIWVIYKYSMFYFQSRGAVLGNNFISSVVAIPGHWSEHHPLRGQRQAAHLPGHRQVGPSSVGGALLVANGKHEGGVGEM